MKVCVTDLFWPFALIPNRTLKHNGVRVHVCMYRNDFFYGRIGIDISVYIILTFLMLLLTGVFFYYPCTVIFGFTKSPWPAIPVQTYTKLAYYCGPLTAFYLVTVTCTKKKNICIYPCIMCIIDDCLNWLSLIKVIRFFFCLLFFGFCFPFTSWP